MDETGRVTKSSTDAGQFLILPDAELLRQCDVHTYRSSGPGGQKKNKTSSAVRLHHRPSGLISKGEEDRSQHVNKRRALRRLRLVLATTMLQIVPLEAYAASDVLRGCLKDGKLVVGRKDKRVMPVINEVLSVLNSAGGRVSDAAAALGVSTAGLVKFLQILPQVWRRANHIRRAHDLPSLGADS